MSQTPAKTPSGKSPLSRNARTLGIAAGITLGAFGIGIAGVSVNQVLGAIHDENTTCRDLRNASADAYASAKTSGQLGFTKDQAIFQTRGATLGKQAEHCVIKDDHTVQTWGKVLKGLAETSGAGVVVAGLGLGIYKSRKRTPAIRVPQSDVTAAR